MIIVIGKSGQLAQELNVTKADREVRFLGRKDINLFDESKLFSALKNYPVTAIINASAYTAVDKAEVDIHSAYALNSEAVRFLANYCQQEQIRFIHVSTDFVFNGSKTEPYVVSDKPHPINVYGQSKLAGENAIHHAMDNNYAIVRTSWLYSCFGDNFVKTMLRLMNERKELGIVADQFGCPTYARGLAAFLWQLCDQAGTVPVYHYSDGGQVSWFEFAKEIYSQGRDQGLINREVKLTEITTEQYRVAAIRPKYSCLTPNGISVDWRLSLSSCLGEVKINFI